MKIIKVFLILFPMIFGLSIGTAYYLNDLELNIIIPEDCNGQILGSACRYQPCAYSEVECVNTEIIDGKISFIDSGLFGMVYTAEDLVIDSNDNALFQASKNTCKACREIELLKPTLIAKKQAYKNYVKYSMILVGASSALALITFITYLAIKYSVVRTIGAISIIWIIVASVWFSRLEELLLVVSPVILFWLYRFIRYGPSKMLKDKT